MRPHARFSRHHVLQAAERVKFRKLKEGMSTAIQWTDVTDNIIVVEGGGWWCRMISEGCKYCYASKLNQSEFFGGNKLQYTGKPPKLILRTDIIDGWERQRIPKRHFVASMTDVFGEWVSFQEVVTFMRGMWRAPKQTFQILTKRPDHMARMIGKWLKWDGLTEVPRNIWLGVSVENQEWADKRIPVLLSIPANVRFLSVEPLLGPVKINSVCGLSFNRNADHSIRADGGNIDWVIVGGESGPNARPCNVDWIRSIVRQCKAAGVSCFVKQLGSNYEDPLNGVCGHNVKWPIDVLPSGPTCRLKHSKGGDISEWPEDLRVRQFPV